MMDAIVRRNAILVRPGPLQNEKMPALQHEIQSTFLLQKSEIAKDVLLDLVRLGFGIDLLHLHDDLLDGVLAVAALDNLEAWAIQAQGAFRHEQCTWLLILFVQAAAGS